MYGIVIIEMILVFSNVCGKQRRYRRTEHPIREKTFPYLDKVSDGRHKDVSLRIMYHMRGREERNIGM